MTDWYPTRYFAFAIALITSSALLVPIAASGQYVAPRTPDGHPDLQGNWSNATVTPVQRPEGGDDTFADAHLRLRLPVTA